MLPAAVTVVAATILVPISSLFSEMTVFVADFLFLFFIVRVYLCDIKFRRLCEMYS